MKILARRTIMCLVAALIAGSCGLSEIGGDASIGSNGGIWGGPVEENGGSGALQQICYVTALDYQRGYDWRADQARENVKCSLIVYADGRQIMKVPVGAEYETGSDPDMHRMIGGHLYTDYSTSEETVIRKDGKPLFRYPGRESICGMLVSGEDTYTLGQNRSGEGFSYRKNGEVIVSRERGYVIGTLRQYGDTLAFSFYEMIRSAEGEVCRYYMVKNGTISQIAVREDVRKVWDVMYAGDEIFVASLVGIASPVLFIRGNMVMLSVPKNAVLLSVSLIGTHGNPGAEIMYSSGSALYSSLWQNGKISVTFPKNRTVSAVCSQDGGVCCTVNPSSASSQGLIYRCGELHDMPAGYSCVGSSAMGMVNGILHIGMSANGGGEPLLWKDGETETLNINGYISSVSAY